MDLRNAFGKAAPYGDPERTSKGQAWYDSEFAAYNKQLDSFLAASKGPFFGGAKFSAADVLWFSGITAAQDMGIKVTSLG